MSPEQQNHEEWSAMLHAFIDGELDSVHSARFERHLETCAECQAELASVNALRRRLAEPDVKWQAPAELRSQVLAALSREVAPATQRGAIVDSGWRRILRLIGQWSLVPSFAALAASLLLVFNAPNTDLALQDQIVASHVRSLLADHLADVRTSNQHTVKPWFNGKIDFAPPVVDLANQGYPLVGGRVDYIDGKVVAALVYRRGGHVINLFIWPRTAERSAQAEHDGYNIRDWSSGGLAYWAISDIGAEDLGGFHKAYVSAAGAETERPAAK